jgi:hypothetical protein
LKITEVHSPKFWTTLSKVICMYVLVLTKKEFGDIFINSSGHPGFVTLLGSLGSVSDLIERAKRMRYMYISTCLYV